MEEIDITVTTLLCSVLSRVNVIYKSLSDDLQVNVEEVLVNITNVLKDLEIVLKENDSLIFLDKVTIYNELNAISHDLSICLLLFSNNVNLEDALYNISLIMKKMSEYYNVFNCCDNNSKIRVLK